MPIYEYQCQNCGHQLEEFQRFSDAPLTVCPNCNQSQLQKQISATNFQLKGTGWYVTDTRDKGKPKPATTTDATETVKTEAPATETKTETKPTTEKPATKE